MPFGVAGFPLPCALRPETLQKTACLMQCSGLLCPVLVASSCDRNTGHSRASMFPSCQASSGCSEDTALPSRERFSLMQPVNDSDMQMLVLMCCAAFEGHLPKPCCPGVPCMQVHCNIAICKGTPGAHTSHVMCTWY